MIATQVGVASKQRKKKTHCRERQGGRKLSTRQKWGKRKKDEIAALKEK